jgi:hypothetical protein
MSDDTSDVRGSASSDCRGVYELTEQSPRVQRHSNSFRFWHHGRRGRSTARHACFAFGLCYADTESSKCDVATQTPNSQVTTQCIEHESCSHLSRIAAIAPTLAQGVQHSSLQLSLERELAASVGVGSQLMVAGGSGPNSGWDTRSIVDILNVNTGMWTTANLSQPRADLAGTSVGNLALFAGGAVAFGTDSLYHATKVRTYQRGPGPARSERGAQADQYFFVTQ